MSEWKEYNGRAEQIAEIRNNKHGYLLRSSAGTVKANTEIFASDLNEYLNASSSYLICNPHPLADMICQQARTGQPVWIKKPCTYATSTKIIITNKPDWNIPSAEYSFTEFEKNDNRNK